MPLLNEEEYPNLSHLNLMIATQYERFCRWNIHSLSVLSAKSGIALFMTLYLLTLLEIVIVSFKLSNLKQHFSEYYYYPFGMFWVVITYIFYRYTISNDVLLNLTLYPEEYIAGVKLSFIHYLLSITVFMLFIMNTKSLAY